MKFLNDLYFKQVDNIVVQSLEHFFRLNPRRFFPGKSIYFYSLSRIFFNGTGSTLHCGPSLARHFRNRGLRLLYKDFPLSLLFPSTDIQFRKTVFSWIVNGHSWLYCLCRLLQIMYDREEKSRLTRWQSLFTDWRDDSRFAFPWIYLIFVQHLPITFTWIFLNNVSPLNEMTFCWKW